MAGSLLGLAALLALHFWTRWAYWNYSEGVYVQTARLFRHGADLYGHVVVSQPPGVVLFGTIVEAIRDSLGWVRFAVGLVQLGTGVLGAIAVWRMTGSRVAAMLAPPLALLTPWAVHEHGALTPDILGAPILLAAALIATRADADSPRGLDPARMAAVGGAVAALAPLVKVPFVVPALALVLALRRREALVAFVVTLAVEAAVVLGVFGTNVWQDAIHAQFQSGRRSGAHMLLGIWGQEGWNEFGLVIPAAALVLLRRRWRAPALARVLLITSAALLLTLLTNVKSGTGLNILVPLEAMLVPLALSTVALAPGRWRIAAAAGPLICLVMTASLIASPRTAWPFIYPGSQRNAWGRVLSSEQVHGIVAQAAACPRQTVYTGPPFFAYLAHRPMPDDQPDQFLTTRAAVLAPVARRMQQLSANHCP